ncbi:MAG: 3-phosphoshikimate 1-carboxyvinyltransferase [Actinomycetota bacterium]|nr:3-phosphoshikimate 1-carboxyvinyltransferase [Actinomycetota bacterium]
MEIHGIKSIKGEFKIPGDKSISHRSVILSSITGNNVAIENFLFCQDCIKTLDILNKLGVKIEKINGNLIVYGKGIKNLKEPEEILDVGNSGTTIRIMSGLLSATNFMSVLSGDKSINSRPMERIIKPLQEMGAKINGRENNTKAPLVIIGNPKLKGKKFELKVSSAQVKSCILMAALHAIGSTEIMQPQVSRDHTERMLQYFGADITYDGKYTKLNPGKKLSAGKIYIPGDISSAAFFIVATLVLKNSYTLMKDIGMNPIRSYFIEILRQMGGKIVIKNQRIINNEPVVDIEAFSSKLNSIEIGREKIPGIIDEIPILCVAAAKARGKTVIRDAGELRFKESDRIKSIVSQFKKLGVDIKEKEDGMIINGDVDFQADEGAVESFGDHRVAMSLSILALLSKGNVTVLDSDCINTSFPGFIYNLKKIMSQ